MITYFDASALVRLVATEDGSDLAAGLWDGAGAVVASTLAYAEARAALAARHRNGDIGHSELRRARDQLDGYWTEIDAVSLDDELARSAGNVSERSGLRGADAVHLASALAASGAGLVLATWDRRLAEAARAAGLRSAPPDR